MIKWDDDVVYRNGKCKSDIFIHGVVLKSIIIYYWITQGHRLGYIFKTPTHFFTHLRLFYCFNQILSSTSSSRYMIGKAITLTITLVISRWW